STASPSGETRFMVPALSPTRNPPCARIIAAPAVKISKQNRAFTEQASRISGPTTETLRGQRRCFGRQSCPHSINIRSCKLECCEQEEHARNNVSQGSDGNRFAEAEPVSQDTDDNGSGASASQPTHHIHKSCCCTASFGANDIEYRSENVGFIETF